MADRADVTRTGHRAAGGLEPGLTSEHVAVVDGLARSRDSPQPAAAAGPGEGTPLLHEQ